MAHLLDSSTTAMASVRDGITARLLNNRPLKSKIAMIVTPLILIALYGMGFELWAAYQRYTRAQDLERANKVSDYILRAAGIQAKERGFTATVLSNPKDQATLQAIATLRQSGDTYLDSALLAIDEATRTKPFIAEKIAKMNEQRTKEMHSAKAMMRSWGNRHRALRQLNNGLAYNRR